MRVKMIAVHVVDLQLSLDDGRFGAHEPSKIPESLRAGPTSWRSSDTAPLDGDTWPSKDFQPRVDNNPVEKASFEPQKRLPGGLCVAIVMRYGYEISTMRLH